MEKKTKNILEKSFYIDRFKEVLREYSSKYENFLNKDKFEPALEKELINAVLFSIGVMSICTIEPREENDGTDQLVFTSRIFYDLTEIFYLIGREFPVKINEVENNLFLPENIIRLATESIYFFNALLKGIGNALEKTDNLPEPYIKFLSSYLQGFIIKPKKTVRKIFINDIRNAVIIKAIKMLRIEFPEIKLFLNGVDKEHNASRKSEIYRGVPEKDLSKEIISIGSLIDELSIEVLGDPVTEDAIEKAYKTFNSKYRKKAKDYQVISNAGYLNLQRNREKKT